MSAMEGLEEVPSGGHAGSPRDGSPAPRDPPPSGGAPPLGGAPALDEDRVSDSGLPRPDDEEQLSEEEIAALMSQPALVRMVIEAMVRRALPVGVQRRLSSTQCITLMPRYASEGFLDDMIEHYGARLMELTSEDAAAQVRRVIPLTPVKPGDVLGADLLALASQHVTTTAPVSASFKPRLPEPNTYEGPKPGMSKVASLKQICQWMDSCQTSASLAGLPETQQVAWAASFLRGIAASWWAGFKLVSSNVTFDMLKTGLVHRFVGQHAFELLCADLEGKTMVASFSKYENFRAWFVQTVAAMSSFAPSGRMWSDTVLIDKLLMCLTGSLYYEGVVLDPRTLTRPSTLSAALRLMDNRHDVLLMRGQAHEERAKKEKSFVDVAKAGASKAAAAKRAAESDAAGPSGSASPPVKKRKEKQQYQLPPVDYIMRVHGLRNRAEVQRHIDDSKKRPPVPLKCPVCDQGHYVTKCPRHPAAAKAFRERQVN